MPSMEVKLINFEFIWFACRYSDVMWINSDAMRYIIMNSIYEIPQNDNWMALHEVLNGGTMLSTTPPI